MDNHKVVSRSEWIDARKRLLAEEKSFTRARDRLSQQRRDLPWERVDKEYVFEGPSGKESLSQLFDGRTQLVVYHFMFDPGWKEGCKSCSFWADNLNGIAVHLRQRDVTPIAISRAPIELVESFRKRMGWTFKWVSSFGTSFNHDYQVTFTPEELTGEIYYNYEKSKHPFSGEAPGISVFFKNPRGEVFHTYSCYTRGLDMLNVAYHYLDLVPKGRDEEGLPHPMAWVRHHDRYDV
ncbi:MAG TPA: thioredoxin family protein [Myxococcota bacterium]|nr:thioredoxin family protein [Myxococcota bacterium]